MKNRLSCLEAAFLIAVCLLAFPRAVLGQGRTWAGTSLALMVEAARWRLGSLRVNASLSLANTGYDTDVYYGYLDQPVPDFALTASVPVQVLLPLGKKAVLELNDSPQYQFYLDTEKERAWNNIVGGRVHFALEKVYIQAGGGLSNVRQRMSPELDVNIRQKSDSLDGIILWQASRDVSLAALYGYARYDYGESEFGGIRLAETLNRKESYIDIVSYLQPSTKIRLFLDGQYGLYTFTETASKARNTRSYGIFGGLAFVPGEGEIRPVEPARGSISLGYELFDIIDPAFSDGSGLVGAINVSVGLFKKTTARAFLSRGFTFSVFSDGTFYLSTAFGGGISRRLSRKAIFNYDLSFARSKYPAVEGTGMPAVQNFRFTSHAFGLDIRLARYLGITFQTILARRILGDAGTWRSRNFYGLSLVYGVPSGEILAPMRGLSR